MTKSTITRERLEEIRDCCWMDDLGLSMYELSELASMALAAMDSESASRLLTGTQRRSGMGRPTGRSQSP